MLLLSFSLLDFDNIETECKNLKKSPDGANWAGRDRSHSRPPGFVGGASPSGGRGGWGWQQVQPRGASPSAGKGWRQVQPKRASPRAGGLTYERVKAGESASLEHMNFTARRVVQCFKIQWESLEFPT